MVKNPYLTLRVNVKSRMPPDPYPRNRMGSSLTHVTSYQVFGNPSRCVCVMLLLSSPNDSCYQNLLVFLWIYFSISLVKCFLLLAATQVQKYIYLMFNMLCTLLLCFSSRMWHHDIVNFSGVVRSCHYPVHHREWKKDGCYRDDLLEWGPEWNYSFSLLFVI